MPTGRTYFDLALLRTSPDGAIAFARSGSHFAVELLACDESRMARLLNFRRRIDRSLKGEVLRPTQVELVGFGRELFSVLFSGSVRALFDSLIKDDICLHIVSDHPKLQALPWEYLQEPNGLSGPRRDRSIVRVNLERSRELPDMDRPNPIRVVLAYAEPRGTRSVPWPETERSMKDVFKARLSPSVELKVIRAARGADIQKAVASRAEPCHIFHFLGHGGVRRGKGHLLLHDGELDAPVFANILAGAGVRMAVLSACHTSAGNYQSEFAVTAKALVAAGVPAVLASQLSLPAESVAVFVGAFYESLATDYDIDRSVAEARIALNTHLRTSLRVTSLEWGLPTLHRNVSFERLFGP